MGLSMTSIRMLALTSRQHTITNMLSVLTNQELALSRETSKLSKEYQNALNTKKLQYSSNGGATYTDISYSGLMSPSSLNQYNPVLLTTHTGKVVVDDKYRKYAEIISPDGKAGGCWEGNRSEILSELLGVDSADFDQYTLQQKDVEDKKAALEKLKSQEPMCPVAKKGTAALLQTCVRDTNFYNWYNGNYGPDAQALWLGDDKASAEAKFKTLIDSICAEFKGYLGDNADKLTEAGETYKSRGLGGGNSDSDAYYNETMSMYFSNYTKLVDTLFGIYQGLIGSKDNDVSWYDTRDPRYAAWKTKSDSWKLAYQTAEQDYNNALANTSSAYSAEQEREIDFYDTLFSSIAAKGWEHNAEVNDSEYLNQVLQNNNYTLTQVRADKEYDNDNAEYVWNNSYQTDIALNNKNIFAVSDADYREIALAKYEDKKRIIQAKENRLNIRMDKLKTEQSAIKTMLDSYKEIMNNNIERNFNLFS